VLVQLTISDAIELLIYLLHAVEFSEESKNFRLVKKFTAIYGTLGFSTAFKSSSKPVAIHIHLNPENALLLLL